MECCFPCKAALFAICPESLRLSLVISEGRIFGFSQDLLGFAPEPNGKLDLATTLEAARSSGTEGHAMKGISSGGIVTKGRIMSRSSCSRMWQWYM
jgi:hypothetical protein